MRWFHIISYVKNTMHIYIYVYTMLMCVFLFFPMWNWNCDQSPMNQDSNVQHRTQITNTCLYYCIYIYIAFQLKGLRKILNMETTYINRENTNEEVYRRANAKARTDNAIRPLSQVLKEKRIKLLGHIVRRPGEHPQHQITFYTRSLIPRTVDKRRVGRPRLSWIIGS